MLSYGDSNSNSNSNNSRNGGYLIIVEVCRGMTRIINVYCKKEMKFKIKSTSIIACCFLVYLSIFNNLKKQYNALYENIIILISKVFL